MIIPMKKLTVVCVTEDRDQALDELGALGAMHISSKTVPEGEKLEKARRRLWRIQRALKELPRQPERAPSGLTPEESVEAIWTVVLRRRLLGEELAALQAERERVEPFGQFEPDEITALAERGLTVKLYTASPRDEIKIPDDASVIELHRDRKQRCFAVVCKGPLHIDAREEPLPEISLGTLDERIERLQGERENQRQQMKEYAGDNLVVVQYMRLVRQQVNLMEANLGMGKSGPVSYLRGYVPAESIPDVEKAAEKEGWALLIQEPGPGDSPPTLIRNPKWVSIIEPVFKFINIAPGYREVDISALFLLFFSLFFAMIVGDAGYGAIFLGLAFLGRATLPKAPKVLWTLLIVMSVGTIIWGLLTGNIFGMQGLPPVFTMTKIPWLTDEKNLMFLCFLIGAIHLTLAHGWNVIRGINSMRALSQFGWICTTWFMFFVARTMVLGKSFPSFMMWALVVGVVLIAVFMTPFRLLKAEWFNHVMLPLNLISNFVDVVSYVRLFAVGMATFAMASAFNQMAGDLAGGVVGNIIAAVVLFGGHTLNILLATMGVLVHGIRLNTLEFSGHLGLEWTGQPYNPLTRKVYKERA